MFLKVSLALSPSLAASCSMQGSVHNKFLLAGFFKYFSRLYSAHYTGPSRLYSAHYTGPSRLSMSRLMSPILDTDHVPGPLRQLRLESQLCHSQLCSSPLRIEILSGARRDRFKLPATVPSRTASLAGSEAGAAAGRCCPGSPAARLWQPLAEPLAG